MIIYAGIDGTGPEWFKQDPQYEQDFSDSHVKFLSNNWFSPDPFYHRGPTLFGLETTSYAKLAYSEVIKRINKYGENTPIFLAGYSRGGAAVIDTAHFLKKDNLPIEGLILFDPVDRSLAGGSSWRYRPISDNVKTVVYAQRNPQTYSRESFGNCGTTRENEEKTDLFHRYFFATHGGLGGCPWEIPDGKTDTDLIIESFPDCRTAVTYGQDAYGSWNVRAWMWTIVTGLIAGCRNRQRQISNPVLPPFNRNPGTGQRIHIVKPGDWLSKIAITYYGDMNKWRVIYDYPENRRTIGANPDLIKPGQRLVIP